jgi:hypothetical protein
MTVRADRLLQAGVAMAAAGALTLCGVASSSADTTFLGGLHHEAKVASTVPANGDVNPYGVAMVPRTAGRLMRGDVLVSNFNDRANLQGTGSTIVEISPDGTRTVFARIDRDGRAARECGGVGLTTALVVLRAGWVVVGSLPTTDGSAATARAGCLFVLDSRGDVARVIRGGTINGPWDMTALDMGDHAALFVTNVLNGTVSANGAVVDRGTVVRVDLSLERSDAPVVRGETVIGSGFAERTDPAALVIGPTGVALATDGTLYVADTLQNRIAAIPNALSRTDSALSGIDVSANGELRGPLGLVITPQQHLVAMNGGNGNAVEITPAGAQVATKTLDTSGSPRGSGALFGAAVAPAGTSLYFVDDATNTLDLLH